MFKIMGNGYGKMKANEHKNTGFFLSEMHQKIGFSFEKLQYKIDKLLS